MIRVVHGGQAVSSPVQGGVCEMKTQQGNINRRVKNLNTKQLAGRDMKWNGRYNRV